MQFLPGCGRPCGLAGRPGVPGEAARCLRFSSSQELGYDGSEGVLGAFCGIFRAPGCPELSASFRSWEPSMMKCSSSSRAGGWR